MKLDRNKIFSFMLAAVFALALAGCGGGGGTAQTPDPEPPVTVPDTSLADAQDAAQAAYDAAKAAVDGAEANRDSDSDSYDAALQALGAAAAANSAAQAATTTEAAEAAQADAETARDNAVKYAGMVNKAKADADAADVAAKAQAAANKVAGTKETAIATEADSTTTLARPFDAGDAITGDGTSSVDAATMYRLTVKHDGSMSTVDVLDERNMLKGDPKFSSVARFGDGQMLVRNNSGTSREIIVLHTDIEDDTPTAFNKVYPLNANDDPDRTGDNFRSLTVILTGDPNHLAHIDLGIPTPGEDTTSEKTFSQDDTGTLDVNEGMHPGRFDGAMGTYLCATADCVVTVNDKGVVTGVTGGTLTFTPATGAMVDVADSDYLYYGFWLNTTTKDGAITSYNTVQTFATSSLTASTGLASVTGTASYEGGAAGVYVHETTNEDGTLDVATSGRFTADVALTAHFSGNPLRVENTLDGTISNFDLDGGPSTKWNVKVSATGLDTDAGFTGNASGMTGDNGSLSGRFHGAGDEATDAPPVLMGEFNANFTNGHVAGAFGTRLDD